MHWTMNPGVMLPVLMAATLIAALPDLATWSRRRRIRRTCKRLWARKRSQRPLAM